MKLLPNLSFISGFSCKENSPPFPLRSFVKLLENQQTVKLCIHYPGIHYNKEGILSIRGSQSIIIASITIFISTFLAPFLSALFTIRSLSNSSQTLSLRKTAYHSGYPRGQPTLYTHSRRDCMSCKPLTPQSPKIFSNFWFEVLCLFENALLGVS